MSFYIIIYYLLCIFYKKKHSNVKTVTPSPSVITLIDPPLITPTGATPLNTQAISTGPEKRKEKKGFFSKFKKSLKHPDETEELIPTPSTSPEGTTKMMIRKSHDISVTCFYSPYIRHIFL